MSTYWSPALADLVPYIPGEQSNQVGLVKLNTNENPFGPSPAVIEALRVWPGDRLRLYPDPDSTALREALAHYHGVEIDSVFVGNGSDEVLAHAFCALLRHDLPILMPDISYSFYKTFCLLYDIDYMELPLDANYRINVRDYGALCGGVILANPNAPTGHAISNAEIEYLLTLHPNQVVIVDEAYADFSGATVIPLLDRYPNLLIVRTFSKSRSLAGIRVGYALGNSELIAGLDLVKNSFNSYPLTSLSIVAAIASLGDQSYFTGTIAEIVRLRQWISEELRHLGLTVLPSSTNFIFVTHPTYTASQLMTGLRRHRVLVRHLNGPRIQNFLRITIGSESDCFGLLAAFEMVLSEQFSVS
ncbi:histidinol-phosphate transaminase [Acidithiobacillus thiooxidans]|jgi:histidinol-phosphate aminotransferase|uniref:histidinol-phosphate transaminase n=1 Tax=Acidithiobacillus TaxID=119977 RepID=UPI00286758B2|nr:histidinol-phosphate transaminase [Acidithiobacillus thiooxidans]MDD5318591.1 histidinol-phosphate transaminase [Candidatus Paceibacterota bacterium]MDD5575534.1 histidinol-phosphate transaminase [Acidithiobacillus sp.]MDR7927092.1 histidinol-phosphate transaminase [Acidithiobacillus thiooxidans]